ncbi:MAG: hypothetical protein HZA78_08030 [Candidatus Schekmanbacteria bacterium]|nr:hypothetical protein [Candidatus Schekmanbacteria bacterium]
MSVSVSRVEIWELLDNKAMAFENWMNSDTPEAGFIKTMFLASETIALDSPMFQNQIVPLLLNLGVIDQEVISRVQARISAANSQNPVSETETPSGMKRYKASIPAGTKNPVEWVSRYCNQDHYVKVDGNSVIVETSGDCAAPGVMEVSE